MCSFQEKKCFLFVHMRKCPHTSNCIWKLHMETKVGIEKKNLFLEKIKSRYDHKQVTRIL